MRYITDNHKPTLSSDTAPSSAKVKPSSTPGTYDLSFTDDGGKYAYAGTRSTKENQYVLLFDPERKAFVLHRVDSTLNMNLTRTPSNTDADALKEEFPHLDSSSTTTNSNSNNSSIRVSADGRKRPGLGASKGKGKASAKNAGMVESKRSSAAPAAAASSSSNNNKASNKPEQPAAAPTKKEEKPKPKRSRSPVDSEEEDDESDDDILTIENPDPVRPMASVHSSFNRPAAQQPVSELGLRRFSSFQEDESDEDADAEYDEDDLIADEAGDSSAGDGFKLPSPLGRNGVQRGGQEDEDGDADADAEADGDMEPEVDDLEALLEQELEGGAMDVDSESSVSEED